LVKAVVKATLCKRKRHPGTDVLALTGKEAVRAVAIMRVVVADTRLIASTGSSALFLASVDAV
jgi:hypothetical protein